MSNALAIASVTRALLDLLNDGLVNNDVAAALGQAVAVSALPPDRILAQQVQNAPDPTQLNLYLYHVTFNPGWRSAELPTRDSRGDLVAAPLLPLDLHYLLTAYGATDLHSEILLGYAMQLLHETPILTRAALRRTLTAAAVNPQLLPPAYAALRAADLADQVELVKIAPEVLSTDEMSKVWTSLQSHYRTSTSYHASVVLIESRRPARNPLPVLTRGPRDPATGRDIGVFVQADLLPPVATIDRIEPRNQQLAVRMGESVDARGHLLDGASVIANIVYARTQQAMTLPVNTTPQAATFQLPTGPGLGGGDPTLGADTDNWRCGVYDVSLRIRTGPAPERITNSMPMVVAPTITSIAAATAAGVTTFTVGCAPRVRRGQSASLIVGTQALQAEPFAADSVTTLTFRGRGFEAGTMQWARLRVDGIDSLLVDRSTTPPSFSLSDRVAIP